MAAAAAVIEVSTEPSFVQLAERLTARAKALAEALAADRRLATDPRRWRRARLLWPLFSGD